MKYQVFSLRDVKAESYGRPIFARAQGEVLRDLATEVNRKADDNRLFLYAADFHLFHLGEFDDFSGEMSTLVSPKFVVDCSSLVAVPSVQ